MVYCIRVKDNPAISA